jgi:hypothetical protein
MRICSQLRSVTISVFCFALLLSSCSTGETYKELAGRPEAHLFFPGSRVLGTTGNDEHSELTGIYPAELTIQLTVDASMPQIYAWYERELTMRGWTLQHVESVNGDYYLFGRGTQDVFGIRPGTAPTTYVINMTVVPKACATSPPTARAFVNCG